MAAITTHKEAIAAGFVFNEIYMGGDTGRETKCIDVTIPAAFGGSGNTIGAGCFGLVKITEAGHARTAANAMWLAGPSFDQTKLYIYNLAEGADATRATPTDTTAAIRLVVRGKEG